MTGKKDFLGSLAQEVEAKKSGKSVDESVVIRSGEKKERPIGIEDLPKIKTEKVEHMEKPKIEANQRPSSFQEEVFERLEPKRKKVNPTAIVIAALVCLALIGISYLLFFAPKIVMPDFSGKKVSDVGMWAKQNSIPNTMIMMNSEFNNSADQDVILVQSIPAGKKIKNTTPLTFTISKGADPDEKIVFPDIKNMKYDEIKEWVDKNKLQKTKINTQYNTIFEKDSVISYDLKSVNENNFTRGTSLTIIISKGTAPVGTITVENFVGKVYEDVSTWATSKKINLAKSEVFHDTIEKGRVVSQGVKVGETIQENDTLSITVSKGKAVKVPNLVGYSADQLEAWTAEHKTISIFKKSVYSDMNFGQVISQSIPAGSEIDSGGVLELTVSNYMPIFQATSREWLSRDYLTLHKWVDDVNAKGGNIQAGAWGNNSKIACTEKYPTPGMIVEYHCLNNQGNEYATGCDRPLPLDSRISYVITVGEPYQPNAVPDAPTWIKIKATDVATLDSMKAFCSANPVTCNFVYKGTFSGTISVKINDVVVNKDTEILSGTAFTIEY